MQSRYQQVVGDRKPTKLYIIGNGFDLRHGIPSRYGDFKNYVRKRDREIFDSVEDYLPAGDDWASLESAFADIDANGIFDDLDQFMPSYASEDWSDSGHHDFQYEVGELVQRLSSKLTVLFGDWIRSLPIPTSLTAKSYLKHLDTGAAFLNFNYTSTLQDLYGVPGENVLHIHGEAKTQGEKLILGHGWNPVERRSLNDRDDISEIDTRLMEAHSILDDYFLQTFKPSEKLILQNQAFFDQLDFVDSVHVLGHSLSDVDLPYLKALLKIPSVATARWLVACQNEEQWPEKRERLIQIGVSAENALANLWTDYS
ncbi:bacteriophage abortive infection AbiH family protein [Undibacterium sp. Tian12W]|uniref:bacteriophage abortive infection AbiH family protein n=1 Tax=Undibacterium sp. Tian12W TaxID=3413054 RepID=UPI003BF42544